MTHAHRLWRRPLKAEAKGANEEREAAPARRQAGRRATRCKASRVERLFAAAILATVLAPIALAGPSEATEIQVYQESSPGRGDFAEHLLGRVLPLAAAQDAALMYNYRGQKFRGDTIELVRDRSHLFFVDTTEGLVLGVIHDDGQTGNRGGRAGLNFDIQGAAPLVLVKDDASDRYLVEGGRIITQNRWINGFTDGFVLGPLSGDVVIVDVKFFTENARRPAIAGLESWAVVSFESDPTSIELVLEEGRRARFVIIPELSEPVQP